MGNIINYQENFSEPTFKIYRGNVFPDKKYLLRENGWQAIATIEVTGKRIWASWMAGGTTEPDPENYIVLTYSDDGGKSWVDPFITIDNDSPLSRGRDPVLWLDPVGSLWLFYGFYALKYTYAVKIINPEDSKEDMIISDPIIKFSDGVILNKPIVSSDGKWLCMYDPRREDRLTNYCLYSDDLGETWKKQGEIHTDSDHKDWQEGALVEKNDGTLWALLRIEGAYNGGIEQSFSSDGGRSWTKTEYNLAFPFYGPGSKFCMRKLSSGSILFVNNNSSDSTRTNMSAYLSKDDGKTWHSLLLDGRGGCAYPDVTQDAEGNIYVIFDCDRKGKYEIRYCKFTEEDVIVGDFVTKDCVKMAVISKNRKYTDVVKVNYLSSESAEVTDENDKKHIVYGKLCERTINNLKYEYFNAEKDMAKLFLTDGRNLFLKKEGGNEKK